MAPSDYAYVSANNRHTFVREITNYGIAHDNTKGTLAASARY